MVPVPIACFATCARRLKRENVARSRSGQTLPTVALARSDVGARVEASRGQEAKTWASTTTVGAAPGHPEGPRSRPAGRAEPSARGAGDGGGRGPPGASAGRRFGRRTASGRRDGEGGHGHGSCPPWSPPWTPGKIVRHEVDGVSCQPRTWQLSPMPWAASGQIRTCGDGRATPPGPASGASPPNRSWPCGMS